MKAFELTSGQISWILTRLQDDRTDPFEGVFLYLNGDVGHQDFSSEEHACFVGELCSKYPRGPARIYRNVNGLPVEIYPAKLGDPDRWW